jgi:DnaJ like chaperone protein
MGWIGKLFGGTVGFVLGGPLGAIAGAAFGHVIDKSGEVGALPGGSGPEAGYGPFGSGMNDRQQAQLTFFIGTFSMLARVVAADGRVSREEEQKVAEFMDRDLHLDPQSRATAIKIFNSALQSSQDFDQLASQFYGQFRGRPEILELLIDILYRVAAADGTISDAEEQLISRAGRLFGYSSTALDAIRRRYVYSARGGGRSAAGTAAAGGSYAVLGIDSSASNDEVKRAYRKLAQEYHPDRIASKGLPEEFNTFAHEKFREIQEAYEAIKKERGI